MVWIGVAGCVHGRLDFLYEHFLDQTRERQIECKLLLCCGDFQSTRDEADLDSMECPPKYRTLGDFPKYYSGERLAPCLTIFVGGNHEASRYLQELPLGGWVAPRIFYLGRMGILRFEGSGFRIGGISGIYHRKDYLRPREETMPLSGPNLRSIYRFRKYEWRLLLHALQWNALDIEERSGADTQEPRAGCDVFLSHDWPRGVMAHGDCSSLWKRKPWMRDEYHRGVDGAPALKELLESSAAPRYWFAAHRHCHYVAHTSNGTCFTALDQTLPGCTFLTFFELPGTAPDDLASSIELDPQWLRCLQRHFDGSQCPISPITLATLERIFQSTQTIQPAEATHRTESQVFPQNPQTAHILEQIGVPWESLYASTTAPDAT